MAVMAGSSSAGRHAMLFAPANPYNRRGEPKGCARNDNDEFAAAMLASALVEIQRGAVELEPDSKPPR
jgi:hypothetical protein